ncbi:hypothetical protein V8C34DRAFT_251953 [Trichoderma compactum]
MKPAGRPESYLALPPHLILYFPLYSDSTPITITYDHIRSKIRGPVCSPIVKRARGRLVVEWVTISEHRLLYVFFFFVGLGNLLNSILFWEPSCLLALLSCTQSWEATCTVSCLQIKEQFPPNRCGTHCQRNSSTEMMPQLDVCPSHQI